MNTRIRWHIAALVALAPAVCAVAQPVPAKPPITAKAPVDGTAAPTPEAISLAGKLVDDLGGGGMATMSGLSLPLARMVRQMGVRPDQSKAVMSEAIMPVLMNHSDDLTSIQINSYATTLSINDMKAVIAFYESPPGKRLVQAHGPLMQANMTGVSALFDKLKPEFEDKTRETLKAHGWSKS